MGVAFFTPVRFQEEPDMTPSELHRAVARATGESRRQIDRLGFSLVDPTAPLDDLEPALPLRFLNWDRVSRRRYRRLAIH